MSWILVQDLMSRRESLMVNLDRDILTKSQSAMLGRLMADELEHEFRSMFDDDDDDD